MPVTNVRFHLSVNSGNDAVVSDPQGSLKTILQLAIDRLDRLLLIHDSEIIPLRDENGNRVGEVWAEIEEEDE